MGYYILTNFRALPVSTPAQISGLAYNDEDVLDRPEDVRVRGNNLAKAISLAKSNNLTTAIIIKTKDGLYKVTDKVLANQGGFVYTAGKLRIPLRAVYSVDFY
jgi:hypothetical protein